MYPMRNIGCFLCNRGLFQWCLLKSVWFLSDSFLNDCLWFKNLALMGVCIFWTTGCCDYCLVKMPLDRHWFWCRYSSCFRQFCRLPSSRFSRVMSLEFITDSMFGIKLYYSLNVFCWTICLEESLLGNSRLQFQWTVYSFV
mgnify:CR=1 FL=1